MHGDIKTIKPDSGVVAFISMVMPFQRRRQDEISKLQGEFLATYRGKDILAPKAEPHGKGDMAMGGSDLTSFD